MRTRPRGARTSLGAAAGSQRCREIAADNVGRARRPAAPACFGPDGLLRRHDFTIDVNAGAPAMLYATDYRDVDGIVIPTKRRAWLDDDQLVPAVAIDMGEITVR